MNFHKCSVVQNCQFALTVHAVQKKIIWYSIIVCDINMKTHLEQYEIEAYPMCM